METLPTSVSVTNRARDARRERTRQQKRCEVCRERFEPKRGDAKYCSPACRQGAHRERVLAAERQRRVDAEMMAEYDAKLGWPETAAQTRSEHARSADTPPSPVPLQRSYGTGDQCSSLETQCLSPRFSGGLREL
jgi:hypothetical protein